MRLIFVRHAETTANAEGRFQGHADFSLSARGQAQAQLLKSRFLVEGLTPTHLYSSPLKRCAETAEIIGSPGARHRGAIGAHLGRGRSPLP
jgi:broad specificity phosphatase PhoE